MLGSASKPAFWRSSVPSCIDGRRSCTRPGPLSVSSPGPGRIASRGASAGGDGSNVGYVVACDRRRTGACRPPRHALVPGPLAGTCRHAQRIATPSGQCHHGRRRWLRRRDVVPTALCGARTGAPGPRPHPRTARRAPRHCRGGRRSSCRCSPGADAIARRPAAAPGHGDRRLCVQSNPYCALVAPGRGTRSGVGRGTSARSWRHSRTRESHALTAMRCSRWIFRRSRRRRSARRRRPPRARRRGGRTRSARPGPATGTPGAVPRPRRRARGAAGRRPGGAPADRPPPGSPPMGWVPSGPLLFSGLRGIVPFSGGPATTPAGNQADDAVRLADDGDPTSPGQARQSGPGGARATSNRRASPGTVSVNGSPLTTAPRSAIGRAPVPAPHHRARPPPCRPPNPRCRSTIIGRSGTRCPVAKF